jgi:predicted RNA binding protein YcfA (HicA-like mRNA interferase family)
MSQNINTAPVETNTQSPPLQPEIQTEQSAAEKLQDEINYLQILCEEGECSPEEAAVLQAELRHELIIAEALEEATKPYADRARELKGMGTVDAQLETSETFSIPVEITRKHTELPSLKARRVVRALRKAGFSEREASGSHVLMVNEETGATTTVPVHASSELDKNLLRKIVTKDAGLTVDEFKTFL